MSFVVDNQLSLREIKRRATRAAIDKHATELVAAHGFDAVTVEDICAAAGISRRTFFNYVDSKETAVAGDPPRPLTEEEIDTFAATDHEDFLAALLQLARSCVAPTFDRDAEDGRLLRCRKKILAEHPQLRAERLSHFHLTHRTLVTAAEEFLRRHPHRRHLDGPVVHEAGAAVAITNTAMQLGMHGWMDSQDSRISTLITMTNNALTDIKEMTR